MNINLRDKPEKLPPETAGAPSPAPRRPGGPKGPLAAVLIGLSLCVVIVALLLLASPQINNTFQKISRAITSPTVAAWPTLTPLPSATPVILSNPQLNPGRVIYSYPFDAPQGWPIMMINDDYASIQRSVVDGVYRWDVTAKKNVFYPNIQASSLPGKEEYYQISMDVRVDGPPKTGYGIVFGLQPDGFWLWDVNEDGTGVVAEMTGAGWQAPVGSYTNLPVQRGKLNTLTVKFSDRTLFYYLNGRLAGEYTRPATNAHGFISGQMGLSIQLDKAGDHAIFEIDNYVVSVPEKFGK